MRSNRSERPPAILPTEAHQSAAAAGASGRASRRRAGWQPVTDTQLSPPLDKEIRLRMDEEEREYEEQVRLLMARQRRLSILAGGFLFLVVGAFTLATFLAPGLMARPVWHGFSPAMLFSAVAVYPLTWLVGLLYTIRANKLDGLG
ncbi:MAG: hypothetical protein Kow00129_04010 [Thermoleophilia bacterium]